jgi:hypothetical protein
MKRTRFLIAGTVATAGIIAVLCVSAIPKPAADASKTPSLISTASAADISSVGGSTGGSNPVDRRAYFGELHLHTGYSFDAYTFMGTRTTPEDAYRFAKGEPVTYMGQKVQRTRPLDFTAVTDHAEYMGVINQLDDPNSDLSKSELGKLLREHPLNGFFQVVKAMFARQDPPELHVQQAMATAWTDEIAAANRNNEPGKFSTLIAYEWGASPDRKNLHRNVIFRNTPAAVPFSSADSIRPEDLWSFLDRLRGQGIEALAIPHNADASGGLMFDWNDSDGHPISEHYAQERALNEPLTETFQTKGQSETVPELSPADEFSNFEVMEELLTGGPSPVNGSYARQALGRGLVIQSKVGANPFKLGFVGGSDYHNGLSNADENAYAGVLHFSVDPAVNLPEREYAKQVFAPRERNGKTLEQIANEDGPHPISNGGIHGSAGLTGVWAEQNTREAIYDALRRKETFATSGPQIRLRFFGGWDFKANALDAPDWASRAYSTAVPMGGDLPVVHAPAQAPSFIVQAAKDPASGNLDRIQIVKIWLEGGDYREKVFDVVWSKERKRDAKSGKVPAVRNTVDLKTATFTNTVGAPVLSGVWRDPEFDAAKPAVYYARAIAIPTPRWNTLLAVKRGLPLPEHMPATIQERALSSPIWFTPLALKQ